MGQCQYWRQVYCTAAHLVPVMFPATSLATFSIVPGGDAWNIRCTELRARTHVIVPHIYPKYPTLRLVSPYSCAVIAHRRIYRSRPRVYVIIRPRGSQSVAGGTVRCRNLMLEESKKIWMEQMHPGKKMWTVTEFFSLHVGGGEGLLEPNVLVFLFFPPSCFIMYYVVRTVATCFFSIPTSGGVVCRFLLFPETPLKGITYLVLRDGRGNMDGAQFTRLSKPIYPNTEPPGIFKRSLDYRFRRCLSILNKNTFFKIYLVYVATGKQKNIQSLHGQSFMLLLPDTYMSSSSKVCMLTYCGYLFNITGW